MRNEKKKNQCLLMLTNKFESHKTFDNIVNMDGNGIDKKKHIKMYIFLVTFKGRPHIPLMH